MTIGTVWDLLTYFRRSEFKHPDMMQPELLLRLDELRHRTGLHIEISSGWRDDGSSHENGWEVDITDDKDSDGLNTSWRYVIVGAAYAVGFPRIGEYDGHVHLGMDPSKAQGVAWVGKSR